MAINWQQTCCAWHGEYAEAKTKNGGVVRLKRAHDVDGILVMRFSATNQRIDSDYVLMTEAEAMALCA